MKVTLRIVGLFLNETFEMTLKKGTTVKDVVEAYRSLYPGKLSYLPLGVSSPSSPISFTHILEGKYNFDGLGGPAGDSGKSLGGRKVKKGTFTLGEAEFDTYDLAWQYYVVSKGGKVKSKTTRLSGFTTWDETPNYRIVKDDTIIWRLVAIANATDYH